MRKYWISIIVAPFAIFAMARAMLFGYIDPNTGGLIFQLLVAIFAIVSGLLFFFSSRIKLAVGRLRRYVRSKRGLEEKPVDNQE